MYKRSKTFPLGTYSVTTARFGCSNTQPMYLIIDGCPRQPNVRYVLISRSKFFSCSLVIAPSSLKIQRFTLTSSFLYLAKKTSPNEPVLIGRISCNSLQPIVSDGNSLTQSSSLGSPGKSCL